MIPTSDPSKPNEGSFPEEQELDDEWAKDDGDPGGLSPLQRERLLSGVKLDEARKPEHRLGLRALARPFLAKADGFWLEPWTPLKRLDERLRLMGGKPAVLAPLLALLERLAEADVCPTRFLRHVVLRRLAGDFDYRNWNRVHGPVLDRLATLLIVLTRIDAFSSRCLQVGARRLVRDVFLCKYVLRALVHQPSSELTSSHLAAYLAPWRSLRLEEDSFLSFLRENHLSFLDALGDKLPFERLVALTESLSTLSAFLTPAAPPPGEEFPAADVAPDAHDFLVPLLRRGEENRRAEAKEETERSRLSPARQRWRDLRLWGKAPDVVFSRLSKRGVTRPRFLRMHENFLALLRHGGDHPAMMKRMNDVFRRCRAEIGLDESVRRLLERLDPTLDLPARLWHLRRLMVSRARQDFLEEVEHGLGRHPRWIDFTLRVQEPNAIGVSLPDWLHFAEARLAEGRSPEELRARVDDETDAFRAMDRLVEHMHEAGGAKWEPLRRFFTDVGEGTDGLWSDAVRSELADLPERLHSGLLKYRIVGHGIWGRPSLQLLHPDAKAGRLPRLPALASTSFSLDRPKGDSSDPALAGRIAAKIDWKPLEPVAAAWSETNESPEEDLRKALAEEWTKARQALVAAREEKKMKAEVALERKLAELATLQDALPGFDPARRSLALLLYGSHRIAEKHPSFGALTSLVFRMGDGGGAWMEDRESLADALAFCPPGAPTLEAFATLARRLAEELRGDDAFSRTFTDRENDPFVQSVTPFLIPRRKIWGPEALDAALRKALGLPRIEACLAAWSEWRDRFAGTEKGPAWRIVATRSAMDVFQGQMGGTCLGMHPDLVVENDVVNLRLVTPRGRIVGNFLAGRAMCPSSPTGEALLAFGLNPLPTVANDWSIRTRLTVWLRARILLEQLSRSRGNCPLLLATRSGIVSNTGFGDLVLRFETRAGARIFPPSSFSLKGTAYDSPAHFSPSLLIVDPARPKTRFARSLLERMEGSEVQ